MPIYEYVCQDCKEQFELLVRTDERAACPRCASKKLTRLFSTFAAHDGASSSDAGRCPQSQTSQCPDGQCPYA